MTFGTNEIAIHLTTNDFLWSIWQWITRDIGYLFQIYANYIKLHTVMNEVIFSIYNLFSDTTNIDACSGGNKNNIKCIEQFDINRPN